MIRGKWKRASPRGSRLVTCRERMNKMRVCTATLLSLKYSAYQFAMILLSHVLLDGTARVELFWENAAIFPV